MIILQKIEKDRLVLSAKQARLLAIELNYLAEEAEDHELSQLSQIICDEDYVEEIKILVKPVKI